MRDATLFAWLKNARHRLRRLGAVCVGAFLLAEAGLLSGRRVTAHWRFGSELARRYPRIKLVPPQLWVKDANIYTSAGISAGIDLALEAETEVQPLIVSFLINQYTRKKNFERAKSLLATAAGFERYPY